jgi:putative DNA methylase
MKQAKKLIEVAMPIKEISAESVRDKSIRHGHISTLHLWWARRPLPVCRAVVFASLVPDPLDENCPQAFRDAIELLLGKKNNIGDPYKPYADIPWTAVFDPMEDNLRNRLQMFIGKFTDEMQQHLLHQKPKPGANNQLNDNSLIKWDNKNNEIIINKARKLIWVAHNSRDNLKKRAIDLLADFDKHYQAIKDAENELYSLQNRHNETKDSKLRTANLDSALELFLSKMPKVFDPFAGGGAIPLEAARLGCKSYGNDINPVAHIIQKGSLEFPQKYGKPIIFSRHEFEILYGRDELVRYCKVIGIHADSDNLKIEIPNRLAFDVEFYANKILEETEKDIGHLFPTDTNGFKPVAYYWVRVASCSNPSCKAEVPLLKGFYLVNTPKKQVHLKPIINGTKIDFEINTGNIPDIGWLNKSLTCPCCGSTTSAKELKLQAQRVNLKERLVAVIMDSKDGKSYRLPTSSELINSNITEGAFDVSLIPNEEMKEIPDLVSGRGWGINKWSQMFSKHQLFTLQKLVEKIVTLKGELKPCDYNSVIYTYLAIWFDKIAAAQTSFGRWNVGGEKIETPFSKQAIPMMFDFPEGNIFSGVTGSAKNQLDWIIRYINSESDYSFSVNLINASSGDKSQFPDKFITAVVTDPPYYDAIAYADLSDFFYVWLKRTLGDIYPLNFATPNTPKSEECTALKHHHNDNKNEAKQHFENKLTQIFDAIEHQTSDIVSIMFAHQSTEAWTTLCNSILGARMNITGSWAMDTEMANRTIGLAGAALESSVTVSCKPCLKIGVANFKTIEKEIRQKVEEEVELLYNLGFRGADLLTACFGQAVSVFGNYEKVERGDGEEVTVAKLLEIAKESAFNALLKGFDGDDYTKFYIGWLQLYGFTESDFDDAAKFSRVGLSIDVQELFTEHILTKNGNKQTLGTFEERIKSNKNIGDRANNFLIDQVHRAMSLYKGNNRKALLHFINKNASQPENNFWRVLTSLCEILPSGSEDHKQAFGLLTNKESLIRESKQNIQPTAEQASLEL